MSLKEIAEANRAEEEVEEDDDDVDGE